MQILQRITVGILIGFSSLGVIAHPTNATNSPLNLTVISNQGDDFANLIERGETSATNTIKRAFAKNSRTNQVSLVILGEHNAQKVPMMKISVSRAQWKRQPKIKVWTKYYRDAGKLLGFSNNHINLTTPRESKVVRAKVKN